MAMCAFFLLASIVPVDAASDPAESGDPALSEADRAALAALEPGTASGEFAVAGQAVRLAHATVVFRRDFPGDPEKRTVVLADVAVPDEVLLDEFGLHALAREGRVHAVEVVIGPDGKPGAGHLHHRALAGVGGGGDSASLSVSGMHRFLPGATGPDELSGRLQTDGPESFLGVEYRYSALFRARPLRPPPPTHSGEAAARSGPGKAVAAFLRAVRAGDRATLRRLVRPSMVAQLDGPDGAAMAKAMRSSLPAGLKVVEVTERGDIAEVVAMKSGRDGRESIRLQAFRQDDAWKIGMGEGTEEVPPPRPPPTPEQEAAARTAPGRLVLEFADAIRGRNLARMRALSENPRRLDGLKGPLGGMMLEMLSVAFPYDLRVTRVTEEGDHALVEAESALVPEPLKIRAVRVRGKWRIADEPAREPGPR